MTQRYNWLAYGRGRTSWRRNPFTVQTIVDRYYIQLDFWWGHFWVFVRIGI